MNVAPAAGRRVLLLEDDPGIRHLVRRTLEREGYAVLGAGDFAEARHHMAEAHVDLLVLDYQLSGTENGLDFYRQLQAEGRDLPAILVTGFSDETRILEAMRAGLRDLIPKTANFVELVPATLERVFAQVAQERRLKEAEAAGRAKDNFLATLSHELRTPLTPVLALVSTMREDPRLPADLREDLNLINRNVTLEARLIDDLLDLTRISRGKLELRLETVDLTPLLEHALATSREGDLSGKNVTWRCDLAPGPMMARADPARLTQVFWNLLKNALKFTPDGGSITVSSGLVGKESALAFQVSVADTGVGIAPEALPRIFDAFEQGGRAITQAFGGLGLGLAISKALVDLHGGTIVAQSAGLGQGALFTVELPLSAPAGDRTPADEAPAGVPALDAAASGLHLLLVEDHPDTAAIMGRMLRRAGFRVTSASKVQEALRKVEEAALPTADEPDGHPIRFVVSDLGLPDGSGVELMAELRAMYGLRGIALSGYGMEEDVRRAHEAGFLRHLTKPVEFGSLLTTLREVLAQREEWEPEAVKK
jgi:signal transduction histidine kinase